MGYGRKAEDPEPGRCRRTDGKKWRCSKEAYPDSKYCERHMHRGKNRSRKPVEMSLASIPTTHHSRYPTPPPPSLSISTPDSSHNLFYPYSSSSSSSSSKTSTASTASTTTTTTTRLHLDTGSYYSTENKDYRCVCEEKRVFHLFDLHVLFLTWCRNTIQVWSWNEGCR